MFNQKMAKIKLIPRWIAIILLTIYHYLISPFLGTNCRFYPSCSQYSKIAIQRFGLFYGGWLTIKRLLRCHPLNPGGVDLVPDHRNKL
jgi:uncharacterized protein